VKVKYIINIIEKSALIKELKSHEKSVRSLLALMCFGGLINGVIVGIIIFSASSLVSGDQNILQMIIFSVALVLFFWSRRSSSRLSLKVAEDILADMRLRLTKMISETDLDSFNKLGSSAFLTALGSNTLIVSQASMQLAGAVPSAMLLLASLIIAFMISVPALLLTLGYIVFSVIYYQVSIRSIEKNWDKAIEQENYFYSLLNHFLDGFKELKLSRSKRDDIFTNYYEKACHEARDLKVTTGSIYTDVSVIIMTLFYLLLGMLVFVLPKYTAIAPEAIVQLCGLVLFIAAPLNEILSMGSTASRVESSVKAIHSLEEKLQELATEKELENGEIKKIQEFSQIKFNEISFSYLDNEGAESFKLGPLSLHINQGETLFITGGNGSGKTTLIHLLACLFKPMEGNISVDDEVISPSKYSGYRSLFGAIFNPPHLFDRLYGIEHFDIDEVRANIEEFDIASKTEYKDGKFSNLDLSTGQRKRLALASTLAEDRNVMLFDEVAADQDPQFRDFYYHKILPRLKAKGKTIIVISHDDAYFHCADRILKMECGQLVEL
jgi:putative ATP-binding cassette transporter